jgi:hypothetical protein
MGSSPPGAESPLRCTICDRNVSGIFSLFQAFSDYATLQSDTESPQVFNCQDHPVF